MNTTRRILLAMTAFALLAFVPSPVVGKALLGDDIDVYVLYSAKAKKEQDALVKTIDKKLNVKSYNVDVLKLADYSGKQKAVAKIEKADLVVILGEGPVKILKGTKFKSDVLIVSDGTRKVRSSGWNLNIVAKGTKVSKLPDTEKHLAVATAEDLKGKEDVLDCEAILVDDAKKNLLPVVGALISMKLDD